MKYLYLFFILFFILFFVSQSLQAVDFDYHYPYDIKIEKEILSERRQKVIANLSDNEIFLATSADYYIQHSTPGAKFNQSSYLFYLTFAPHQNSILVLSKAGFYIDGIRYYEALFIKSRSELETLWEGKTMTAEIAENMLGVKSFEISKLKSLVESQNFAKITIAPYTRAKRANYFSEFPFEANIEFLKHSKMFKEADKIQTQVPYLEQMRSQKDPWEIQLMSKANKITIDAFDNVLKNAKSLRNENNAQALIEYGFKNGGSESPGYTSIVASGNRACILHYVENNQEISENELLLMDCGAQFAGYTADVTRTFPVSGKFSKEQRLLYELTLRAMDSAIAYSISGNSFFAPDSIAKRVIGEGLVQLGIIEDVKQVTKYFPHGTSHHLGLDVHDVGARDKLVPGNVITIEPGIYIPNGSKCDKKWHGIGIRIEDDILITTNANLNLTAGLAKSVSEIEALINNTK